MTSRPPRFPHPIPRERRHTLVLFPELAWALLVVETLWLFVLAVRWAEQALARLPCP